MLQNLLKEFQQEQFRMSQSGAGLIAKERECQQRKYSQGSDVRQFDGELLRCGILVALDVAGLSLSPASKVTGVDWWPEQRASRVAEKYGDDHIRRLVVAGALIAAEIDRLTLQNEVAKAVDHSNGSYPR